MRRFPGSWRLIFSRLLCHPATDRVIAIVATIPFSIELWNRWTEGSADFARMALGLNILVQIITMLSRAPAQRVSMNPLFWLMACTATYGMLFFSAFASTGHPVVPGWATNAIAVFAIIILLFARLSLGRSIGLVPAQRRIVTRGAYRWVRHPMYTGNFFALLAVVLSSFAWINLCWMMIIMGIFLAKSFIEENFLRSDPEYAEYLTKVRWRWLPGVF
jgi:protein-S-isoprenylcysteine O-methyltransferase Ste14